MVISEDWKETYSAKIIIFSNIRGLEIGIALINGLDLALNTKIGIWNHVRIRHGLTSDI